MTNQSPRAGRVKEITSSANPIVKSIKALQQKKAREETGTFLVEGLKLVIDASEAGWQITTLLYAKGSAENQTINGLAAQLRTQGTDILEVSEKVLTSVTRKDNPQSLVAVVRQKWFELDQLKPSGDEVWIGLDRIRDPGNLGTIIRTADALGAAGIILIGETTDVFSLEAVRATMGSLFHVQIAKALQSRFIALCNDWTGTTLGTHLNGSANSRELTYDRGPVLLVMGNEQQGLPDSIAEKCEHLVKIPMVGKADSLNLAISTGIMLYEIQRKNQEKAER